MEKITIEYHTQNNRQFSKLLMAAVMKLLKDDGVEMVLISQDDMETGNIFHFAYAGCGGGSNEV